ncbi:MAG: protein kinase [Proteobacteria bacterium]|nr:protein kinase [Pseudomonadota bacterium]
MANFEPEAFGKYYLIDRIATGGMAEIFKAKSYSTAGFEKVQVIKRILAHLSDNEEFVDMFIDEAKISVSLQHSNLVQIYDFGKIRENYFIAMEWVDGKDVKLLLRKLAQRRKPLPEEFAVFIAHEVMKGLDYAHKKTDLRGGDLGIVHRDMSPSNVLFSYSGEVKIADFGIAKAEMCQYDTKDGVLKGKFEYMSPEQARGEDVTQQSDLFSAGIILYEMLTGRRLFKTDSEIKTLEKIKSVDIKPPSSMRPEISQRLDAIVMKALTADLDERYRDAREFQQALLEYMYPSTPPTIQRSLSLFLIELFSEERAGELDRMEAGSAVALELHNREPELALSPEWEAGSSAGSTGTIQTAPPSRAPLFAAIGVVVLLLGVVGYMATRTIEPETVVETVEVLPTEGALVLRLNTAGDVYVGDELMGSGPQVGLDHLQPGELTVRIVAEDYLEVEEVIEVVAGERLVMPIKLEKKKAAVVPRTPRDTPKDPVVETPKDPVVETPVVETPKVAALGKLNINIAGNRVWGDIYVDGANVGRTPKFNYELGEGPHTIQVKNDQIGLDQSQLVNVVGGETTKVIFRVD